MTLGRAKRVELRNREVAEQPTEKEKGDSELLRESGILASAAEAVRENRCYRRARQVSMDLFTKSNLIRETKSAHEVRLIFQDDPQPSRKWEKAPCRKRNQVVSHRICILRGLPKVIDVEERGDSGLSGQAGSSQMPQES